LLDFGHAKAKAVALDDLKLVHVEFKKHDPHRVVSNHLANCGHKRFEHENSPSDDIFLGTRSYAEVLARIQALADLNAKGRLVSSNQSKLADLNAKYYTDISPHTNRFPSLRTIKKANYKIGGERKFRNDCPHLVQKMMKGNSEMISLISAFKCINIFRSGERKFSKKGQITSPGY
jgi:hypothetical protein